MNKNPRFFCDNCNTEVYGHTKSCPGCGRFFASVRCPSCDFAGEEKAFTRGCPVCGYSSPPPAVKHRSDKVPVGPLPLWVYLLSICAFIAVIAILIYRLVN